MHWPAVPNMDQPVIVGLKAALADVMVCDPFVQTPSCTILPLVIGKQFVCRPQFVARYIALVFGATVDGAIPEEAACHIPLPMFAKVTPVQELGAELTSGPFNMVGGHANVCPPTASWQITKYALIPLAPWSIATWVTLPTR